MVEIVMYNLKGLYMGPVAQIASMLAIATNDNKTASHPFNKTLNAIKGAVSFQKPAKSKADILADAPAWLENKEDSDRTRDAQQALIASQKDSSVVSLFGPKVTE